MDTSEKYIEMCRKAVELHKEYAEYGDWYVEIEQKVTEGNPFIYAERKSFLYMPKEHWVFLPRQDQLQKMIDWNYKLTYYKYSKRYDIEWQIIFEKDDKLEPGELKKCMYFDSVEKILLLMIMREKYNKTWDGKDWISGIS